MFELPLIFVSGLLGSSHCVGMCGPFALSIGSYSTSWPTNLRRQLVYSSGRIFTYTVMGVCAGFAGMRITTSSARFAYAPSILAIVAGILLIYQGLVSTGKLTSRVSPNTTPCLAGSFLKSFLAGSSWRDIFLAGLLTGFLPCGLVYAFVAMAAATSSVWLGGLTMSMFGLGTVPLMVATGCSTLLLSVTTRQKLLAAAGWCVIFSGFASVFRGAWFWNQIWQGEAAVCPFC